jgi:hypothetical protein
MSPAPQMDYSPRGEKILIAVRDMSPAPQIEKILIAVREVLPFYTSCSD